MGVEGKEAAGHLCSWQCSLHERLKEERPASHWACAENDISTSFSLPSPHAHSSPSPIPTMFTWPSNPLCHCNSCPGGLFPHHPIPPTLHVAPTVIKCLSLLACQSQAGSYSVAPRAIPRLFLTGSLPTPQATSCQPWPHNSLPFLCLCIFLRTEDPFLPHPLSICHTLRDLV